MSCNNVIATVVVISAGHTVRQRETLKILRGGRVQVLGQADLNKGAPHCKGRVAIGGEKSVAGTTSGRKQLVL